MPAPGQLLVELLGNTTATLNQPYGALLKVTGGIPPYSWAIIAGGLEIIAAIRLRKDIEGEWALGLSGLLLILWGVLLVMMPAAGILGAAWMIGGFALVIGVLLIILSFRLKGMKPA